VKKITYNIIIEFLYNKMYNYKKKNKEAGK